jgi:hypothetical protein
MGTANEALLYVVKDGVATAAMLVSRQRNVRFSRYLDFLNTYASEATGTRLPIRLTNQVHDQASIHLATAETTTSEAAAMAFLDGLEDKLQERVRLNERRYTLAEQFASDPALRFLSSQALWDWTGWHGSEF